jgi:hypothetical protein
MPRFTPRNSPLPIVQEAGLTPGLARNGVEKRKSLDPTEDRAPNLPDRHESYRRSINFLLFKTRIFIILILRLIGPYPEPAQFSPNVMFSEVPLSFL